MAIECPDMVPCCAVVYAAVAPDAAQAFTGSIQGWLVAQVPAQIAQPYAVDEGLWSVSHNADESLSLGAPLNSSFAEYVSVGMPMQFYMGTDAYMNASGIEWHAPGQLEMGGDGFFIDAQSTSVAPSLVPSSTDLISIAQESLVVEPQGLIIDTLSSICGNDDSIQKVSNSTLRRRRRQRAAVRAPSSVAPRVLEEDDFMEDEQSLGEAEVIKLAQELLSQAREGEDGRLCAAARLRNLAFADKALSRAAQLALGDAHGAEAIALASGMHGHVRAAMRSMYANYVIQKIVEVLPPYSTRFIAQELLGTGREVARHRFGCRVLCRLLEHGSLTDPSLAALIEEVLYDARALSTHAFGNYVLRHSLEFGVPEYRRWVVQSLLADLVLISGNQYGSRVVETAFQVCSSGDQQLLAAELLRDPAQLSALSVNLFGRHVVLALLRVSGEYKEATAMALRPHVDHLRSSRYGKLVLDSVQ